MKTTVGVLLVLLEFGSCSEHGNPNAVDALHRDIVKITQQLADIRVELEGLRGSYPS